MGRRHQRGVSVIAIFAVMLVALGAAYWWRQESREASKQATEEQKAAAAQAVIAAQQDKDRQAFEQKVAAEKQKSEYAKSVDALKALHARWNDAVRLADSTSRIQLSGPISSLQAIKRDADAMLVPDCLVEPKKNLVGGMALIVDGFIAYLRDADYGAIIAAGKLSDSKEFIARYEKGITGCGI